MHDGWYQVAYARDITEPLTEIHIGDEPLALIRDADGALVAISAWCPHRGANLCRGGTVEDGAITCPFHAFPVSWRGQGRFRTDPFDVLEIGGLIFVKRPGGHGAGLARRLAALAEDHQFVPGFEVILSATPELVVENAFDQSHFRPVHRVGNAPRFRRRADAQGAYAVEGVFDLPASQWQRGAPGARFEVPFVATAFSPTVVLSTLGGARPYAMITTTCPLSDRETLARLSLIMPGTPSREDCLYLLEQARAGLMQDARIWEAMRLPERIDPVDSDSFVLGFRDFCAGFDPAARLSGAAE